MSALSVNVPHSLAAAHANTPLQFRAVAPGLHCAEATLRTPDDLAAILPFVSQLDGKDGAVRVAFQTSAWHRITAESFIQRGAGGTVRILFGFRDGEPIAALPLCVSGVPGCRIARSLGDPLAQYSDLALADQAAGIRTLGAALQNTSGIDAFLFRRVREDSHLHRLLSNVGARPISRSAAPFADLTRYGDFESFLASQPKKTRERGRLRRRAERQGRLTFELTQEPVRAVELTRRAIAMKQGWLHAQSIPSVTLTDDFWCDILCKAIGAPGRLVSPAVSAIIFNGEPAAIEIGFVKESVYYAFLGAFDARFKAWSPTKLAMEETLRWCFAAGIVSYDLLPPNDPYKAEWTNNQMAVADWLLARRGPAAAIVKLAENHLRPAAKHIYPVMMRWALRLGLGE